MEALIPPMRRAEEAEILRRVVAGEKAEPYQADRVCRDGTVIMVPLEYTPIVDPDGVIVGAALASHRASDLQEVNDQFEARMQEQRVEALDAADHFEARVAEHRAEAMDTADRFEARVDEHRAEAVAAADRFETRVDEYRTETHEAQDRYQAAIDTERAEARSDNEDLQALLQQSQRLESLGQLAGGIAHDFNNLLGVILNYAQFIGEELAAGPRSDWKAARDDVGHLRSAAERAAVLTHQLLAFARREVVQPGVLDLNDVVTDVQQLLRRTIGEHVSLHIELAENLWPVLADTGQIEQVLVNLAVNARDAMSDGGTLTIDTANIAVDAEPTVAGAPESARRYVRLRVSDTGTGMPADIVERVFEPFYTTKPAGTGTGLGLATVYGIVTQAEATIKVHSRLGAGTTFTIMTPATDRIAAAVPQVVPYQQTPTGATVLIVEDDDALRLVTERIFARNGYRVLVAADGQEALALAARHEGEIHLLLTDVVMPNMLGKEVAEKIRQVKPAIEVLYMSGYAQPVLASQGRLDRDVSLIEKPYTAATLLKKAGRILHDRFRVTADGASSPA